MKINNLEKEAIEKISAISSKDKNTVKDVLKALLMYSTLEVYASIHEDEQTFVIPYLCTCHASYYESNSKFLVELNAEPNQAFTKEVSSIAQGDITPSEKFIRKQIVKCVGDIIDITNIEVVN